MQALDESETVWLLEAARGTRLYVPIVFAVTTGVRRSELLAVMWKDLNLNAASLSVRRCVEQTRKGIGFKETKNRRGRTIALTPMLVEALRQQRAKQDEIKALMGSGYHDQDLVFAGEGGLIWKPESFTEEYFRFTRKIGVKLRFHNLRHSHASQLLRAGVSPKVVSQRLGHSAVGITLDVYSHVLPGMQDEAAQKIEAALRNAMEKERAPAV